MTNPTPHPEAALRAVFEENDPMPIDLTERMVKRVRQEIEGEAA